MSLRMFEERKNLLNTMPRATGAGRGATAERIREAEGHIERIRAILHAPGVTERTGGGDGGALARRAGRNKAKAPVNGD